jgi:predicted HTH domain antitoxin
VEVVLVIEPVADSVEEEISIHEPRSEYGAGFQVQLPPALLQFGLSKDDIQGRITEWVVLLLFSDGRISSGKAARLLNMNRLDFIALLQARGIAYINYSPDELDEEIETARHIQPKNQI